MPQDSGPSLLKSPVEVASAIRARSLKDRTIVGVDGFMGSGKTSLSFELAALLGGIRVGIDSYVDTGREAVTYIDKLRLHHLERDLKLLNVAFPYVIVEGICLRTVLERLQIDATITVYVKRISKVGIWHDGIHLENFEHATDVPTGWLRVNELTAHVRWYPHQFSDFIYERVEA